MTVKRPSPSERKRATAAPLRSTVNPALNGALHGTLLAHTGVIGPRSTVPVNPVVNVGDDDVRHAAIVSVATMGKIPRNRLTVSNPAGYLR